MGDMREHFKDWKTEDYLISACFIAVGMFCLVWAVYVALTGGAYG